MSDRCPDLHDQDPIFNGLLIALMMGRRVALLVGTAHEERSRLTDRLAGHLASGGAMVLRAVARPGMSVEDLLLACHPGLRDVAAAVDAIEAELDATGMGVLIIDEAQRLTAETMRDLFDLAATDSESGRFLQVVLAGTPGLGEPELAAVFRLPEPKPSQWRPAAQGWRWAGAAVLAVATGLGAGAALLPANLPEIEPARMEAQPPPVVPMINHAALPDTDLEAEYSPALLPEAELEPDPAPVPPAPPIPAHKPTPPAKPAAKQPPKRVVASLAPPPPASRSRGEHGCRQGPGGTQTPDASLSGIAQGFAADLRSLGRCVGGLLGR